MPPILPPRVWYFSFVCLAGFASSLVLAGCGGHSSHDSQAEKSEKAPPAPITVEVVSVTETPWPTTARVQGTLFADQTTVASTKVAGRVAEIYVDFGDMVKAGDPLMKLAQQDFELRVAQAEASLAQAAAAVGLTPEDSLEKVVRTNSPVVMQEKAVLDEAIATRTRYRQLVERNALSAADLEQAEAAVRVAEARYAAALNSVDEKLALISVRRAELNQIREQLIDTTLNAPMDGFIEVRHVSAGSYVQIGQPVVTIVATNPLRYRGNVPERFARQLKLGQKVLIEVDPLSDPREATISRISPSLDVASRSLSFEADVPNPDFTLRTGFFAEGEIVLDEAAKSLSVPATAMTEFAGVEKVWKVVDGNAVEQVVGTLRRNDGQVEIVSGLNVGDVILKEAEQGRTGPVLAKAPVDAVSPQTAEPKPLANEQAYSE